ncbi:phytanoyl-CoA dioxygenase family protein [Novosphingobium sp. AP12]|uniref:phytanoyl-CoA dioxygenase family protein n=1 Tax=Novosphingobium sp. AP12 TaxID=1144305 RepID=UPI0002721F8C|nr:phytanoyl-CoA dioxygenase family protein [Novosphingobium sp. AP12]EJL20693.1 Phytanoyl-CoA dioxygenase (PhyH) [Novosphingobium sp. AP12]
MEQATVIDTLRLSKDGAQHFRAGGLQSLREISAALHGLPTERAGVRIHGIEKLRTIVAAQGAIGAIAADYLGSDCRPVRAILFDKTAETNWSLAWHQDRTICVQRRIDVEGYGPWTTKAGMQHVAPPFDLLTRMLTLRVHLDDVSAENSPLLIAPGSHRAGRVPVEEYGDVVARCGTYACLAEAGDVWAYATPILHASEPSFAAGHRRVLQIDYSADQLPGGLKWLGI